MTSRAPDARPAPVPAPTARQLGVAPELAVLAVLEAAIHSAIPALCAAQPRSTGLFGSVMSHERDDHEPI